MDKHLKGGSFLFNQSCARIPFRRHRGPDYLNLYGGFRLVKDMKNYTIVRGGSFLYDRLYAHATFSPINNPSKHYIDIGFRVLRERKDDNTMNKQEILDRIVKLLEELETEEIPVPEMVNIPAGDFQFGTDNENVWLDEYAIGKYPITNQEYKAFTDATGYQTPVHWVDGKIPEGKENHPVVNVNYYDAQAYCKWLSKITGETYRLPTEEEWEKAARGADGRRYPWGNEWNSNLANTVESGIGDTTPVGKYSPNGDSPYGVADMVGNVWEWTSTEWEEDV